MELTFYDLEGNPIAYVINGGHIYLFSGKPVAYIENDSVYSYQGKHLGRFENGWLRDNNGRCVFHTEIATDGPGNRIKKVCPMKKIRSINPLKSMKEMQPQKPLKQDVWSERSGEQFFEN